MAATPLAACHPDPQSQTEETLIEYYAVAIRGLRGLRDPAQFRAWIYGIATRKCADVIRATTRRRRLDAEGVAGELSAPVAYSTAEQQIDLATAIRGLPPIHRAAVHLFYLEELSVEEIASVLGVPAGTVKSRLHHARDAIKRQLTAAAPGRNETESRRRGIS